MPETFYRKYRPHSFRDVIGQEVAVSVLTQSLKSGKTPHAFLLTGPRGTGKTTLARLFAAALNCTNRQKDEPCGKCSHCLAFLDGRSLDVIEIDAASHTGVDHIRELRETINTSPTLGQYKVYIIDEAHMLSLGAWNALLKTIEEPPAHVVFLLATTNVGKVPETILSRTLRLDLERFPIKAITEKLTRIAKEEKIEIEPSALALIARTAQGGMRDAEVLFTQVATLENPPIDAERVAGLLGTTALSAQHAFLSSLATQNPQTGFAHLQTLAKKGVDFTRFTLALLEYTRTLLLLSVNQEAATSSLENYTQEEQSDLTNLARQFSPADLIHCLEIFQEAYRLIKISPVPQLPLEIALVKLTQGKNEQPLSPEPEKSNEKARTKTAPSSKNHYSPPEGTPPPRPKQSKAMHQQEKQVREDTSPHSVDLVLALKQWNAIVTHAIHLNASLGVALSTTTPAIRQEQLVLRVKYPFHKERLEQSANRLTLDQAFVTILGFRPRWQAATETEVSQISQKESEDSESPTAINDALRLLGGKLVQESS